MLTLHIPYYDQPKMLECQLAMWDSYPEDLAKQIRIVLVDDASPKHPIDIKGEKPYELNVYRVDQDIPWNQPGARNLGVRESPPGWMMFMDMDMVLPAEQLRTVLSRIDGKAGGFHANYGLKKIRDPKTDMGSPNTKVMHSECFWKCGGYNEDFAGRKGYSDVVLSRTLVHVSKRLIWEDVWCWFYGPEDLEDAIVTKMNRDVSKNFPRFRDAVDCIKQRGWQKYAATVKNPVRFPWHRVR